MRFVTGTQVDCDGNTWQWWRKALFIRSKIHIKNSLMASCCDCKEDPSINPVTGPGSGQDNGAEHIRRKQDEVASWAGGFVTKMKPM